MIKFLDWDTKFFSFKVAQLTEKGNNTAIIGLVSVVRNQNHYGLNLIKGVENFLFLKMD